MGVFAAGVLAKQHRDLLPTGRADQARLTQLHLRTAPNRFRHAPGQAAIGGLVEAARRPAARHRPGTNLPSPHAGEEDVRIVRVHRQAGTSGVLVDEERLLPGFAAVVGAPDAARVLRVRAQAHRANENVLRIVGIHHDARDQARIGEPHVRPGAARVGGFIDAVARRNAVADHPRFARPCPDNRMLMRIDRQRADKQC